MCEMLWNPCVGVVGGNNTEVMHQGIWTWSCTLRGGWRSHAFELNLATNSVKASANFHPFHIHDWISRGISSRIFFPSQVRFEGRVNEKCLLELSRDCRPREREQEERPVLSVKRCFTPDGIFGKFHFARSGNVITATWICMRYRNVYKIGDEKESKK